MAREEEEDAPTQTQDQSTAERRQLRAEYRALHTTAQEKREELMRPDGSLMEALEEMDTLQKNVQRTREQAIDTSLMVVFSDIGLALAKSMTPGVTKASPSEFLARLRTVYAASLSADADAPLPPAAFDWAALGGAVGKYFRWVPSSAPHMLGPLAVEVKERKACVRKAKDAAAAVVRPDAVSETAAEHALVAETERNIKVMRKALSSLGTCDAFELVYNGTSFAQTVENIFTLSFLVKDGLVKLTRGMGGVVAALSARPEQADFASRAAEVSQFVLRLSVDDWEAARERMPAQPRIPTRERIEEATGAPARARGGAAAPEEQEGVAQRAKPTPKGKRAARADEAEEKLEEEQAAPSAKRRR